MCVRVHGCVRASVCVHGCVRVCVCEDVCESEDFPEKKRGLEGVKKPMSNCSQINE